MKKILVVLLMLALAGGLFAQEVSIGGEVWLDLGVGIPAGKSVLGIDGKTTKTEAKDLGDPSWMWTMLENGNTILKANAKFDKVSAWVAFRPDANVSLDLSDPSDPGVDVIAVWTGDVTVDLDALKLSIGHNRLPVAFWSSYLLWGDGHYGIGASSTNRATYIQGDVFGVFFGVASDEGTFKLNGKSLKEQWAPAFYVGYNFTNEDESLLIGASFVGMHNPVWDDSNPLDPKIVDVAFPIMGNLHARFGLLDSLLSVGVNVSVYSAPEYGIFSLGAEAGDSEVALGGKDAFALEGLLDIGVNLDLCAIGFGFGLVTNLAAPDKGGGSFGMKFGLSADFEIGDTGFHIVPGVDFINVKENAYDVATKKSAVTTESALNAGISFYYSF